MGRHGGGREKKAGQKREGVCVCVCVCCGGAAAEEWSEVCGMVTADLFLVTKLTCACCLKVEGESIKALTRSKQLRRAHPMTRQKKKLAAPARG